MENKKQQKEKSPSLNWCSCTSFIGTGRKPCKFCNLVNEIRNQTLNEVERIINEEPDTTGYGDIHRVSLKMKIKNLKSKEGAE